MRGKEGVDGDGGSLEIGNSMVTLVFSGDGI